MEFSDFHRSPLRFSSLFDFLGQEFPIYNPWIVVFWWKIPYYFPILMKNPLHFSPSLSDLVIFRWPTEVISRCCRWMGKKTSRGGSTMWNSHRVENGVWRASFKGLGPRTKPTSDNNDGEGPSLMIFWHFLRCPGVRFRYEVLMFR